MEKKKFAYIACPSELKNRLENLLGKDFISDNLEQMYHYGHDKTEELHYYPDAVVRPDTAGQISQILQWANSYLVPVTTRGRGTGLAGSALPIHGGLCLSMEKFDRQLEIDTANLQAVVEPYVKNFDLQQRARACGLFYPPDPASYRMCSIGGNLAHNSGGPKAVKYGVTRNYVLQLEVILADGRALTLGSRTLKNSTGFSLKDLLIGSEGTLGIITRVVLRLLPLPPYERLLHAAFSSLKGCVSAVHALLLSGLQPCGLELMERTAIEHAKSYCGSDFPPLTADTAAHLLVELDGNSEVELDRQMQQLEALLLSSPTVLQVLPAKTVAERERLWRLRRNVYMGIKAQGVSKEIDFCAPIASLPAVVEYMEQVGQEYGFSCATYGHAGDGNLHVGIIPAVNVSPERIHQGIEQIFRYVCQQHEGTVSAEHGIGLVQQPFIGWSCSSTELELMRAVKRSFDPNNILNPGKIFPRP